MHLRPYQIPIFNDNTTGILGLHWARQLGKSTVLAAWAIYRLLTRRGTRACQFERVESKNDDYLQSALANANEHYCGEMIR